MLVAHGTTDMAPAGIVLERRRQELHCGVRVRIVELDYFVCDSLKSLQACRSCGELSKSSRVWEPLRTYSRKRAVAFTACRLRGE